LSRVGTAENGQDDLVSGRSVSRQIGGMKINAFARAAADDGRSDFPSL
jgi:hypothetical protein